jgi:hypothetical protein
MTTALNLCATRFSRSRRDATSPTTDTHYNNNNNSPTTPIQQQQQQQQQEQQDRPPAFRQDTARLSIPPPNDYMTLLCIHASLV